jgi:spermidine synthase
MSEAQRDRLLALVTTEGDRSAVQRLYALAGHDYRKLRLDRLIHGYVDLQDPTWLRYGYERLYAILLDHLWPPREQVRCFFIGGGAYAFQRYLLAAHGGGLSVTTAEIDPGVTRIAREWLALSDDPRHRIVHEDARTFVASLAPADGGFDLVFGDAFDHIAVPFHLTTQEFARALKARMAPDGIYLVNVVDAWVPGRFLGAFVATLRTVFADVRVVSELPRRRTRRDTYVVVASDASLADLGARPQGDPDEQAVVIDAAEVEALCRDAGERVLTDDHAPVETLLAPVLRGGAGSR